MEKHTISILTITIAVLLLAVVLAIPSEAVDLPYIIELQYTFNGTNYNQTFASESPITWFSKFTTSTDTRALASLSQIYILYTTDSTLNASEPYDLPDESKQFYKINESGVPVTPRLNVTSIILTQDAVITGVTANYQLSDSIKALFSGNPTFVTSDFNNVADQINEELNSTTSTSNSVSSIVNDINSQVTSFQNEQITSEEFVQNITNQISALNQLSQLDTNTLADLENINNALSYANYALDLANTLTSYNIKERINTYKAEIKRYVDGYIDGTFTQSYALNQIEILVYRITDFINRPGMQLTTSDVQSIQTLLNFANNSQNTIMGYGDLDQDVANEAESEDKAEIDYLNELTAETQQSINELSVRDKITAAQTTDVLQLFNYIWELDIIKWLLAIIGMFAIIKAAIGRV